MGFNQNALTVLNARYLLREDGQVIETPEEMCRRIARTIAAVEVGDVAQTMAEDSFYELLVNRDFMPNSPCIANAGARTGQLSACFVLPVPDDLGSIYETMKHQMLIHQTGGGTGFCFSNLREEGATVESTQGVSSGPISFLDVYDAATHSIKQGGMRRGANMATFHDDHPDVLKFIRHKRDLTKLNNFNVSVLVTDKFMQAVEGNELHPLISRKTGEIVDRAPARELFHEMVEGAWLSGEPGCLFIDAANRTHPIIGGVYEATNPCGEQFLDPYDTCNLGSINLGNFVRKGKILWDNLKNAVWVTVRFLDNVIDANRYVLPQIEKVTKDNRRIGLGVMGWADMLAKLSVAYGSEESYQLAEQVMTFITMNAQEASSKLALIKGNFPNWENSVYGPNGLNMPMRNAATMTVAPTGTISMIAGCSSGIEPFYAIAFRRFQADKHMIDVNPLFEKVAKDRGFYTEALMEKIIEQGSVQGLSEVPEDVQAVFVTAHDLTPEQHVRMQAAFQNAGDRIGGMNSISKTINFHESATIEDVEKAYILAWKLGCKGITVYRNNSRNNQPLHNNKKEEPKKEEAPVVVIRDREFTGNTTGRKVKTRTPYGSMHVYLGSNDQGELVEIIATVGKNGGIPNAEAEAISRLASLMLRKGMERDIIDQLRGISSGQVVMDRGRFIYSVADAIAQVLEEELNGKVEKIREKDLINHSQACPDCPDKLIYEEGCFHCRSCGFSKCA